MCNRDAYLHNSKVFSSVLNCLTINEFTVNDCYFFLKEIIEQESGLCNGNIDADSRCTKIPRREPINVCSKSIYN